MWEGKLGAPEGRRFKLNRGGTVSGDRDAMLRVLLDAIWGSHHDVEKGWGYTVY